MSVLMTLRVAANAKALEANADPAKMDAIIAVANRHGLISHRFYGNDTQVLAVDEWETEEGFHAFFEEAGSLIGPMMQLAGVTTEPEITFWRKLDTHDDV